LCGSIDRIASAAPARDSAAAYRIGEDQVRGFTGVFMMHCHMMNHEEMGMMQTVEVYKD
jgi:FtsP/CotA-like multicopper oxidase with cupredoxin domain